MRIFRLDPRFSYGILDPRSCGGGGGEGGGGLGGGGGLAAAAVLRRRRRRQLIACLEIPGWNTESIHGTREVGWWDGI
jgi:hypothetical protein